MKKQRGLKKGLIGGLELTDNLLCKACNSGMSPREFEVYNSELCSGLLTVACIECGYESKIRIFSKKHYDEILTKLEPGTPLVFDFNGE